MHQRVVAEVNLSAIRHNLAELRSFVGLRTEIMAVLKADAYGHGMEEVSKALRESGLEWIGVATVSEGLTLRKIHPKVNICLMSPIRIEDAEDIVGNNLIPFVGDVEIVRALSLTAQKMRLNVRIHLEVDTGMGRSGMMPYEAGKIAALIMRMGSVRTVGLATHFSSAEDDPITSTKQLQLFNRAKELVCATDSDIVHFHAANSAGLIRYASSRMNMVRPGLLIYGIFPAVPEDTLLPNLKPALTLKSSVSLIRKLASGHTIGYGRTHTLKRTSIIATIPVGYGDGYPREVGNKATVLIKGKRAPILGRVCMDVMMVDVTEIEEVSVGSEVIVIGAQGKDRIHVHELAKAAGTTEHDITTRLTMRVPRVYV